jgi:hypothetical protein
MKKIILITSLLLSFVAFAQIESKKNELKLNAAGAVAGMPEFNYEYILSEETSAGLSLAFSLDEEIEQKFYISPYYRYFFGKKTAAGFFVEGFAMYSTVENKFEYWYYNSTLGYTQYTEATDKYSNFALGFGVGAKWLTRKGFIFEISSGIGRNLGNKDKNEFYDTEIVGKGGITVGYRF